MWTARLWHRVSGFIASILMATASYWTLRLAYADRLAASTAPPDIARAIRLAPGNARYWLRWADATDLAGGDSGPAIERALAANPADAAIWIRAGLRAEMDRNYPRAEHCLLEAARLNRHYEPRWTLANYYFRRQQAEEFWRWTRSALEWAHADPTPLFELAWAGSHDAGLILDRAVPNKALSPYLGFLLATQRLDAAAGAAQKLAPRATDESRGVLLAYANRMIDARRPESALAIWNGLCARKLVPYEALDASRGPLLTNGDFGRPPLEAGFDWRMAQPAGVSIIRSESPAFLRLSFSGKQPESCELLVQFVPVVPATRYALRFEYQTAGVQPHAGLRWKVFDAAGGAELQARSAQLSAGSWRPEVLSFSTAAATRCIRLVLTYQRMPGTTRIEGALWLRTVTLSEDR